MHISLFIDEREDDDRYTHRSVDPTARSALPSNHQKVMKPEPTGNSAHDDGLVTREPMMGQGYNDQFPMRSKF